MRAVLYGPELSRFGLGLGFVLVVAAVGSVKDQTWGHAQVNHSPYH